MVQVFRVNLYIASTYSLNSHRKILHRSSEMLSICSKSFLASSSSWGSGVLELGDSDKATRLLPAPNSLAHSYR